MRDEALLLEKVDLVRARLDEHRPLTPDAVQQLRRWLAPRFIHCSSALGQDEGLSAVETAAFLEREIVSGGHPIDRFLAVSRHDAALALAERRAQEGGVIDVPFVQEVHRTLTQGAKAGRDLRPGRWKEAESPLTRRRGHRFRFCPPGDVDGTMARLLEELARRRREEHPFKAIVWLYFHLYLIHPFETSNGKVARLLAGCALTHHGFPPLIIPTPEVGPYLDALAACDSTVPRAERGPLAPGYDLGALAEFLAECLSRTGERYAAILLGEEPLADGFAGAVERSQERIVSGLLERTDVSWRVRATFEVRGLFARFQAAARVLEARGPLYRVALVRAEVVPTHAASPLLGPTLPGAEAGLLGELEFHILPDRTIRGVQLPQPILIVFAVVATAYGMQVHVGTERGSAPAVHHGPARSPEWPTATIEGVLVRRLDLERQDFERRIDALNASPTQRYRLIREQGRAIEPELAARPHGLAAGESPKAAAGPTPREARERRGERSIDGVGPAEPPLEF